jgi:ATP-dependent DNA helicase RecG
MSGSSSPTTAVRSTQPTHPPGIGSLAGVGPTRAKALAELGVNSVGDLLEYFPRDYRFESAERRIVDLVADEIQPARGEVVATDYVPSRPRPRFEATIDDGSGSKLALTFFNGAWLRTKVRPGMHVRVKGKVRFFRNLPQMVNPSWEPIDADAETIDRSTFRAVYPASSRLPSDTIAHIVAENIDTLTEGVREWFSSALLRKHELMGRKEAYRAIHVPAGEREAIAARRRLIYDELMLMQIGLGLGKRLRDGRLTAPRMRLDKLLDERIRSRFGFELTGAQQNAVWEIAKDLQSGHPMNRLLQGDVGSGKTVVALYAMLVGVANKMQSAILAPTEVLAEQHFLTLSRAMAGSSVNVGLYTGRTKRGAKASILKDLANGSVHLAVGTQALIQEDIEFANLGLVIVDEQHRLGVRQRAVLKDKGLSPHYLVMTATPIPRTLALSYFADFDVSVIDELPPGRRPIKTRWVTPKNAGPAYELVGREVKAGRQAYVVVPQIEDSGLDDARSVKKEFDRLAKGPLAGLRLAQLHGQMSADEKQQAMKDFRDGSVDVLVATTVIEVGVDVPNATVMMIDNTERFGLSQLHQLRGRVGRGSHASFCVLISEASSESARSRMNVMCETNDGFEIAERDLQLRGPGEFFGTRQHGLPEFKLADITSELNLLSQAKADAMELLANDPKLTSSDHAVLRAALTKQFGETLRLAQVG